MNSLTVYFVSGLCRSSKIIIFLGDDEDKEEPTEVAPNNQTADESNKPPETLAGIKMFESCAKQIVFT